MLATRSRSTVIRTISKGVFIAAAGSAMALTGAAAANADIGVVEAQSGSTVDADGTHGDWRNSTSGDWRNGMWGDMRALAMKATDGHSIVGDACNITGKGCQPPSSFDPRTISALSGYAP